MPREEFRTFLSGLPPRRGFCVECLSSLYGEPAETIIEYLEGVAGRDTECGNCGHRKETFGADPSGRPPSR